jgi:hypothetical protein
MPFEDLSAEAWAALAAPRERFHSTLATTAENVRVLLEETRSAAEGHLGRFAAEFGALGDTYLDLGRLATMVGSGPSVAPSALAVVERAHAALTDLAGRPAFTVRVPTGGSLADTVGTALADIGRAMGAARVVELARQDRYHPSEHERYLDAFPFGLWSQAERRLAPPLVVGLHGADLRPASLSEYLDGGVRLVLIVDAPATPAPLVRLIMPGVFVAQTTDVALVSRLAGRDGPGIVAIMPEGSAEFVHDPAAGTALGGRLTVTSQPAGTGLRRVGPFTVTQQRDELQQLSELASARTEPVAAGAPAAPGDGKDDPVGKLAAWLLTQADPAKDARQG